MSILLLGSTGMLGTAISQSLKAKGIDVLGVARKNSDFDADISNKSSLIQILSLKKYDALINAAALVNIDYCENNPHEGWKVNTEPVATLANWSQEFDIPLLHISTDHYYHYGDNLAHTETDPVFLLNSYAKQKYAAEAYALTSSHSLVIRTSILGQRRTQEKSLIEWAINSLEDGKKINLFRDAWTSSIDVCSFSYFVCKLFFEMNVRGLLNLAAREVYSKETLIRSIADSLGLKHDQCTSESIEKYFPSRPNCLGLNVSRAEHILGHRLPTMQEVCNTLIIDLAKR